MLEAEEVKMGTDSTKDQAHTELSRQFDADIAEMENGILAMIVADGLEVKLDEVHQRMVAYLKQDGQDMTWLLTDVEMSRLEPMCGRKSNGFPKLFVLLRAFLLQLAVVKKVKALVGPTSTSCQPCPTPKLEESYEAASVRIKRLAPKEREVALRQLAQNMGYDENWTLTQAADGGIWAHLRPVAEPAAEPETPLKITAEQMEEILRIAEPMMSRATLDARLLGEYGVLLAKLSFADAETVLASDFLWAVRGRGGQARKEVLKDSDPSDLPGPIRITDDQIEVEAALVNLQVNNPSGGLDL